MKKMSSLFAAMLVAVIGFGVTGHMSAPAFAQSKDGKAADGQPEKKGIAVRPEMHKLLPEIQAHIEKKENASALQKIDILAAMDKLQPGEIFTLARLRLLIALGENNSKQVIENMSILIDSEFLPENDKKNFTNSIIGTYFNEKNYPKAREWAAKVLAKFPNDQVTRNLVARSYYLESDYANCVKTMEELLAVDKAAGKTSSEENLRLTYSAYQNGKDEKNSLRLLEKMAEFYPTKEIWQDLIYRVRQAPGFNERYWLEAYRLLFNVDGIEEGIEYVDMSELALLSGLPAEAKQFIDAGYASSRLGNGKDAAKHKQLKDKIYKQAADDAKNLDAGEATAKKAKTGVGLVNNGYNYVINNQAERGIALIEEGIARGGLKFPEEAKLHLVKAYLKLGNRAKAEEIVKSIESKDGAAELGRLWLIMKPKAAN